MGADCVCGTGKSVKWKYRREWRFALATVLCASGRSRIDVKWEFLGWRSESKSRLTMRIKRVLPRLFVCALFHLIFFGSTNSPNLNTRNDGARPFPDASAMCKTNIINETRNHFKWMPKINKVKRWLSRQALPQLLPLLLATYFFSFTPFTFYLSKFPHENCALQHAVRNSLDVM